MKFNVHEAVEMHEVLSESAAIIKHYALYLRLAQDAELRQILVMRSQASWLTEVLLNLKRGSYQVDSNYNRS